MSSLRKRRHDSTSGDSSPDESRSPAAPQREKKHKSKRHSRKRSRERRDRRKRSRSRSSRRRERRHRHHHHHKRKDRKNSSSDDEETTETKVDRRIDTTANDVKEEPKPAESKEEIAKAGPAQAVEAKEDKKADENEEAEQKRLEDEVQKRRERVEAWRAARRAAEEAEQAKVAQEKAAEDGQGGGGGDASKERKLWTLSDDEEDENEDGSDDVGEDNENNDEDAAEKEKAKADEPDIDPLDAFMANMEEDTKLVKEAKTVDTSKAKEARVSGAKKPKVFVIEGKAKAKRKGKKGELMENDPDAMAYSSEEEGLDIATALANLGPKSKKKELPTIDHAKMDYISFRKDFYHEVPDLAKMKEEEVNAMREDLENIQVKGKDVPKPIKTWPQAGVRAKILEVLRKSGYEKPTPIQAQAIPAIMSGRDLIGIAKTGSGKTLAFLLPLFRHVVDQPELAPGDGPIALILTPTRELAMQIFQECRKFCKGQRLRTVCVYGGTGISEQIADLKRGAEIIVCTPGRMIDMLAANSGRVTNTRRVTYLVLDEADRMFDLGFEPQVSRIVEMCRPDRQTVMFSATFPRQMEALARKILAKPIEVQVGGRSVVCKDVLQTVIVIDNHQKFFKLLELLGIYQEQGSVLVFVEKQESADQLFRELLKQSYPCLALHGGMDQYDRDSTIGDFKSGVCKLLIATSVAARGLDVRQLILVINYDCPNHYEDYVHRCGRTGRAGRKGYAYTFVTHDQNKIGGEIVRALELSGTPVPQELEELWSNYVAAQEAMGFKVKTGKSKGFSGKGYKFDENEKAKKTEERKMQKSALGLQDSDDEAEEAEELEQKIENMFANRPRRVEKTAVVLPTALPMMQQPGMPAKSAIMKRVNAIASKLGKKLTTGVDDSNPVAAHAHRAVSNVMRGESVQSGVSGATLAAQIAAGINARVGFQKADNAPPSLPPELDSSANEKWEDEVEINDLPQQVRWKITSKDSCETISEYAEVGVTVRGMYFPPGKKTKSEERKLYLYIEGPSERSVNLAKIELRRLILEELARQSSYRRPMKTGRYTVL
ncbi:probable ATP-dependent RNA helicase DDX46 [Oscarella lobularis]|uniref:probable ATP-dependent RNA helicase DDX46 n=1 Tax=Oscarella lobularis TaxID=121494 RepID=UPI003313F7DA